MHFLPVSAAILALICTIHAQQFMHSYQSINQQAPIYQPHNGVSAIHPQPGIVYDEAAPNPLHLSHGAVVRNAAAEAELPQDLVNPFYKNAKIAAGLAKESWFTSDEFPVLNRMADRIPREEIAKIVNRIEH